MRFFEEKFQNSLTNEKNYRDAEIKKINDLLAKEIEDKKKLEEQIEKIYQKK